MIDLIFDRIKKKTKIDAFDVLEDDYLSDIKYRPKTKETKSIYESLLGFIKESLGGDEYESVIMSAAD